MLNKDALVHLQQTAIDAIGSVQDAAPENTIVMPCGHELIDVQKYTALARRFTGTLETGDIDDFVAYTKENAKESADGFIDAENLYCTVYFNLGTEEQPGHGDWRAILSLKRAAPFNALVNINGARQSQNALTDWIEDWAAYIQPVGRDGESYAGGLSRAIQAVRQITLKATSENDTSVGDFETSRTALEQIEARSKLELPGGFDFFCTPYLGLTPRTFRLRLQVLTSNREKDPVLVLRIMQIDEHNEAIARDFKSRIQAELSGHAKLTIGTFCR